MVQIIGYIYKYNAWQEHLLYTKTLLLATHGVTQVVRNVFLSKRCLDVLFRQHFTVIFLVRYLSVSFEGGGKDKPIYIY